MWKIMRGLLTFTVEDLVTLTGATMKYAQSYVAKLKRCGYLRYEGRTTKVNHYNYARYRLIKNTGPAAPTIVHGLKDGNTGEVSYVD